MTAVRGCCCGAPSGGRSENPGSLFEQVGSEWFVRLVDNFYDDVEIDPVLRPLYPANLAGPRKRLAMFLSQYFGGAPEYTVARGHPRLRVRHFRFTIGPVERDAWLRLMTKAVRAGGLNPRDEAEVLSYFTSTATMLMNFGEKGCMQPSQVASPGASDP